MLFSVSLFLLWFGATKAQSCPRAGDYGYKKGHCPKPLLVFYSVCGVHSCSSIFNYTDVYGDIISQCSWSIFGNNCSDNVTEVFKTKSFTNNFRIERYDDNVFGIYAKLPSLLGLVGAGVLCYKDRFGCFFGGAKTAYDGAHNFRYFQVKACSERQALMKVVVSEHGQQGVIGEGDLTGEVLNLIRRRHGCDGIYAPFINRCRDSL